MFMDEFNGLPAPENEIDQNEKSQKQQDQSNDDVEHSILYLFFFRV
jgi:hypothetical protein